MGLPDRRVTGLREWHALGERELTVPENVERLQLLVDAIVDYAIFVLDADGRVASWNEGARRLKGYEPEEIIGSHFSRFYPPEDVAAGKAERALETAIAVGRVEDEGWRVRKDGSRFWANVVITPLFDDAGRLRGFGKVTRDLTDRRRAEQGLAESEERLRAMIDGVQDHAIFMLTADGHVQTWNSGACRLKGYQPEEIIGSHFSRFYPEEELRAGRPQRLLDKARADGRVEDEGWRVRKDGSMFWANVVITALRDDRGDIRGFVKVTRDLSERRRAEQALAESLRQERESAERLRELDRVKNEFVAIVAHDLRSPMSVLSGYAELLLMNWERLDDETKRSHIATILRSARNSSELIDDVLEVASIEAGELQYAIAPYDLEALVRRVVADIVPAGPGSQPALRIAGPLPPALGDQRRHWQALSNLVSNALRYSPVDRPPQIDVDTADGMLRVAVRDHGPGIASEDQDRIFDRFSRVGSPTSGLDRGTGLGLYITRSMVEAQGGRIWVESEPGHGATFTFTIPTASAAEPPATVAGVERTPG